MDGDEAPSSPKKKKVEISADKCIKCMRSGGKKAITVLTLATLKKVLGYVKERYDYEDSTVIEFWERIYDHDPESLVAKKVSTIVVVMQILAMLIKQIRLKKDTR